MFFSIPAQSNGQDPVVGEFNRFLRSHRIVNAEKKFMLRAGAGYWCWCVEYLESASDAGPGQERNAGERARVDYRKLLDAAAFARFDVLRRCRKVLATEDAVPAYAILLDEHLAQISSLPEINLKSIGEVPGIGKKKLEKYGARLLALYEERQIALTSDVA